MGVEKDNVTNFEVRVSIDNPGKELKANMTANAEIVLEEHHDALIVPEAAVTYDSQKNAYVEVAAPDAKNGRKKVAVKIGVGNGTKIQILEGLKQGDKVKITLRYRGREMAHQEIGTKLLDKVKADVADFAKVEQDARFEGRQVVMVLAPR
jgi:multidrug efflux pump subunit AcrA (membrane-fusion protein)